MILFRLFWIIWYSSVFFTVGYCIATDNWLLLITSIVWGRVVDIIATGIALHRYFAHRSFKTGEIRHKFLSWFSILAGQGSPVLWAITHRHHHKHSDTDLDLHSPHNHLFEPFLWPLKSMNYFASKQINFQAKDFDNDRLAHFINQKYFLIWLVLIIVSFIVNWKFCVFFVLAGAGWALIFSGIFNTVSHLNFLGSYRTYETKDQSTNSRWLHYLLGDGLHNNHHHISGYYNQAFAKGEFDPVGWVCDKLFVIKK